MKYIYLVLLFFLSGCMPHFYKAESVVLSAHGLDIIEGQNLSDKCIFETSIPKTYTINRASYSLGLEVKARQVGFRVITDNPKISASVNSMKLNNYSITKLSPEYPNYLPIESEGEIVFVISDGEKIIANESINVNFVACKAVMLDAV